MKRVLSPVIALAVIVCITGVLSAQQSKPELKRHENRESGYSIGVPDAWKKEVRKNKSGVSEDVEDFLVLTGPGNGGNATNITVIVSPDNEKSVEQYAKNLLFSYSKTFKKFTLESREPLQIGDTTFASFFITYMVNDVEYGMMTVFTIQDGKIYQFNALAPLEQYKKDISTIRDIVHSFRFIE